MVSKKYKDNFCVVLNNQIITGPLVFAGTSFLDEWEDTEVEVSVSGNTLTVVSAPGEHNASFLRSVVLDGVASNALRNYQGHQMADGTEGLVILTETLAQQNYPHLFKAKTPKIKK